MTVINDFWQRCENCAGYTRPILGQDSKERKIVGPCKPCMDRERAERILNTTFSGICDECSEPTKLKSMSGVMTCPRCKTQYRNL